MTALFKTTLTFWLSLCEQNKQKHTHKKRFCEIYICISQKKVSQSDSEPSYFLPRFTNNSKTSPPPPPPPPQKELASFKNLFSILKPTFGGKLCYQMLVVSFVSLRPLLFIPACSFSLLLPPNTEALCVAMLGWNTPLCPAQHSSHICVSSGPEKSDLIETGRSYGERSHAGWLRSSVSPVFRYGSW